MPNANIVFGGSGANRTVTVTPAANQSGTATITVTVSDGALTASDTFVLTVTAVNDAPTIQRHRESDDQRRRVDRGHRLHGGRRRDGGGESDGEREFSNTTLVPNANIVFGGSGANRTVTVTPAANQSGTATITVTVSDGALTASDTFVLTVTPVNDPPTISDIAQPDASTRTQRPGHCLHAWATPRRRRAV